MEIHTLLMDQKTHSVLYMEFSRQEYCSELPFPSPGYLPEPGIKPRSPALQADSLPSELPGKPSKDAISFQIVPILQSFHTHKSAFFILCYIGAGIFIYIALSYFPLIHFYQHYDPFCTHIFSYTQKYIYTRNKQNWNCLPRECVHLKFYRT